MMTTRSACERVVERGGDRAGADPLHQRRHRGGVAQPRAMVDVVGVEAGADQLLEQVGLLVAALGRAEAGQGVAAVAVAHRGQPAGGHLERLVPAGLAEMGPGVAWVDARLDGLGRVRPADQRLGQALRAVRVVEAEAALDAQPVLVRRAVAAGDVGDLLVLDMVGDLAAHAAERADAGHLAVGPKVAAAGGEVDDALGQKRAGRAGLDALAAGDAGAVAHRVALVEDDQLVMAAAGHADHVVDLDLAAGAHA